MDYSHLGLDSQMRAFSALPNRGRYDSSGNPIPQRQVLSGLDFDSQTDRGAVRSAHIQSFSFDRGTGGTLTLGSANNAQGLLSVLNTSGAEVVRADSAGLTVTNGSVTIQDSAGSSVIDSAGLVSATSFTQARGTNSADNQAIAGTAITPLENGTLSVILDRNALCLYMFTVDAYLTTSANGLHVYPTINGTIPLGGAGKYFVVLAATNQTLRSYTSYHIEALPSGTNTLILNASLTDDSVGTATVTRWKADYIILGK